MSRNIVVIFTENNARVLINPENVEVYHNLPNAVVNPDLSAVYKVPPHLWELKDGKVVKKGLRDSINRIKHIDKHGSNNNLGSLPQLEPVLPPLPAPEPIPVSVVKPNRVIRALPYIAAFLAGVATLIVAHIIHYLR